jgi:hypothetical protein
MFFIARIVAAMFTGSCGSYNTTRTADKTDLVTGTAFPGPLVSVRVTWTDVKCCPLPPPRDGRRGQHGEATPSPRRMKLRLNDWSAGDQAIDDYDYRDHE